MGELYYVEEVHKTTAGEAGHRTSGGKGGSGPISKLRNNKRWILGLEC